MEIRFRYTQGRGKEKSIGLELWENDKPTGHSLVTQHVWSDHPHEILHNIKGGKFIGVSLKYTIIEEE